MAKKSDEKTLMKLSTVKKSAKDIIIDKGAHVNKEENAPFEEDSKKEIDNTIENSVFLLNSGETVVKDNPKTIATLLSTTESNANYISKRNFQDKDKINFNIPINSEENIEEKGNMLIIDKDKQYGFNPDYISERSYRSFEDIKVVKYIYE